MSSTDKLAEASFFLALLNALEQRKRPLTHGSTTALGREYSVATGRFREAKSHWPLSGSEFEERTVAARPNPDCHLFVLSAAGN